MDQQPHKRFRPRVERLEAKRPLSAGPSAVPFAGVRAGARAPALHPAETSTPFGSPYARAGHHAAAPAPAGGRHQTARVTGITMDRITNPNPRNIELHPPFKHVLVQDRQPVPGQVYNVLFLSVWNGTGRTFTASDGLVVRISNQTPAHAFPVLTGNQRWKPGERIVFYLLTKKYYPLSPTASAGFEFNFVTSPRVVAIPGPSGIFLRLRYKPATFDRVLDTIVVSGPGARGHRFGLPDTAIWEIIPAGTVIPL